MRLYCDLSLASISYIGDTRYYSWIMPVHFRRKRHIIAGNHNFISTLRQAPHPLSKDTLKIRGVRELSKI